MQLGMKNDGADLQKRFLRFSRVTNSLIVGNFSTGAPVGKSCPSGDFSLDFTVILHIDLYLHNEELDNSAEKDLRLSPPFGKASDLS